MPIWEWLTAGDEVAADIPMLGLRTLLTFIALLAAMRLSGKRTVSALAPFDLAVVIIIGEVAAIPIADDDVDMFHGIIPVLMIAGLHVLLSKLNLHSRKLEDVTEGRSTVLIQDGKILKENLVKERVSRRDLIAALRLAEISSLREVRVARLEHSGGVSVIKTEEAQPLTPNDGLPPRMRDELDRLIAAHMDRLRADLVAAQEAGERKNAGAGDASLH